MHHAEKVPDLLPCPFCGTAPVIDRVPLGAPYITCKSSRCHISLRTTCSAELAGQAASWNHRACAVPSPDAELKQFQDKLCSLPQGHILYVSPGVLGVLMSDRNAFDYDTQVVLIERGHLGRYYGWEVRVTLLLPPRSAYLAISAEPALEEPRVASALFAALLGHKDLCAKKIPEGLDQIRFATLE